MMGGTGRDRGRSAPGRDAQASSDARRSVTLVRGGHRWRFECERKDLNEMVRTLGELTSRPGCPLDQFDAALVVQEFEQTSSGA